MTLLIKNERLRTTIRGIVEYLGEHLETRPTLRELADRADMSTFHLLRVYAQYMSETPMVTSRRLRMARARALLAAGHRVDEVAFATGYGSSQAFSNAFRLHFGMPPSRIPTGSGLLAVPARIEWLPTRAIVSIPFRDSMQGALRVFDELFAIVHKAGIRIELNQVYARVQDAHYLARGKAYHGDACVLMEQSVPGLDRVALAGGAYAVSRVISPWPEVSQMDAFRVTRAVESIGYERTGDLLLVRPVVDPHRRSTDERLWEILFPVRRREL